MLDGSKRGKIAEWMATQITETVETKWPSRKLAIRLYALHRVKHSQKFLTNGESYEFAYEEMVIY